MIPDFGNSSFSRLPGSVAWVVLGFVLMASMTWGVKAESESDVFELRPGVLIDPGSEKGYFMVSEGGIDCVSLSDGSLLWQNESAHKPLGLQTSRLLSQVESPVSGKLDLVVLSTETGELVESLAIGLPEGVNAGIDDRLGQSFRAWGGAGSDGLVVAWSSSKRLVQGMLTDAPETQPETHEGAFQLNMGTFATASLAEIPSSLEEHRQPLLEGSQRLPRVVEGRQFLSADGRHVSVSQRISEGASWTEYRWTIYDRSGSRLGAFDTFASYSPFTVVGGNLIFETRPFSRRHGDGSMQEEPLKVRAVSLSNGIEQWHVEVRDTAYNGPYPP